MFNFKKMNILPDIRKFVESNSFLLMVWRLGIVFLLFSVQRILFYWYNLDLFPGISTAHLFTLMASGFKFDLTAVLNSAGPFSAPIEEGDSITLSPNIPAGYTVLLTVSNSPGRGTGFGFTAPVKDPAPSCVLDPADDPAQQPNT